MKLAEFRVTFRRRLPAALAIIGLVWLAAPAPADPELPLFDAHLHYNWEPTPLYPIEKVLEAFRRNNVRGILANSRPNTGTHALVAANPPGLKVVPFIRPYRTRADIQTWFNDPDIYELVVKEYERGYFRGVGEFHIYGKAAHGEVAKKLVQFAVERDLYVFAHCDEEALQILFSHNPRAKIIWAHTGFTTSPARVRELFDRYPALWGELSYRSGITEASGKLSAEWRALFGRYSDRFLLGSDTWIGERWFGYDTLMREYRQWLVQLPKEQAMRVAHGNAERLFGARVTD